MITKIKLTKEASRLLTTINSLNTDSSASLPRGEEISRIKQQAVESGDEMLANLYWCFEQSFRLKSLYLNAWSSISKKDYLEAWHNLVEAENLYPSLKKHAPPELANYLRIDRILEIVEYMIRLYPFWHADIVGVFTSNEEIHKEWRCSICKTPYKLKPKCDHIKGNIYMGELCLKEITEVELKAIAMVKRPFDKNCVTISMGGKHFNELFNFSRLDGLLEMATPLQYWTIADIELIDEGDHEREHIQIGLVNYDIYGKKITNEVEKKR